MTVTRAERATKHRTATAQGVESVVRPQVNLLPPEVGQGRKLSATKRSLVYGVAGVLVLTVAGTGGALLSAASARSELAGVQDETATLLAEQATYAAVPQVLARISSAEAARQAGMATEIRWKPYLESLRAVTPPGVSYDTMAVNAATPLAPAPVSADALAVPGVGQITFTARSLVLPDISAWIDAINTVPGLGDAWFTSATLTDEDGVTFYTVSATVEIRDSALSRSYAPKEGQ